MKEESKFQFKGFKIRKSVIEINTDEQSGLDLDFNLSGKISRETSIFELAMDVKISNADKSVFIEVNAIGNFTFPKDHDEEALKGFLYLNSPALLFPYIRAYVSTLTNLSGIKTINLPTLNFSKLRGMLEKNTTTID